MQTLRQKWLFDLVAVVQCQALTYAQDDIERIEPALRDCVAPPSTPLETLLLEGLIAIARENQHSVIPSSTAGDTSRIPSVVWNARRLLQERYRDALSYRTLGRELNCNPEYLATLFHKAFGETIHGFLRRTRIEKSIPMLRRGEKVEAIALQVGFTSKSGFLRAFRIVMGQKPTAMRARKSLRAPARGRGSL
jgi:AraC-like DNA-binding protein